MTVWWEGMTKQPPKGHLRNWKGEVWDGSDGTRGAHPNSRFTAPAENCPCISEGVLQGHRRADQRDHLRRPPRQDRSAGLPVPRLGPRCVRRRDDGVETTAAATGAVGVVRRDPMAMRPFCGYNMADYWQHWLDMGEKLPNAPKIFNVNWFRTDDNGRFPVAGLWRQSARARVDPQALLLTKWAQTRRSSATNRSPRTSTSTAAA